MIIFVVGENKGDLFFLQGIGGVGDTFIQRVVFAALRSRGAIVLTAASRGVADLLIQVDKLHIPRLSYLLI